MAPNITPWYGQKCSVCGYWTAKKSRAFQKLATMYETIQVPRCAADNLVHSESAHFANFLQRPKFILPYICSSHFLLLKVVTFYHCFDHCLGWLCTFISMEGYHLCPFSCCFSWRPVLYCTPPFNGKSWQCWILVLTTAWAGVYLNRRLDYHLSILALFFPTASFFLLCPLFAPHWGCFLGDLRAGPDQYHAHGQTSLIEMSLQHHHRNSHFHLII